MNKLGLLAGVVGAGMAFSQLATAQIRPSGDLIDGGRPTQIEPEPSSLGAVAAPPVTETRRRARRAARARIAIRPRVPAAHPRRGE